MSARLHVASATLPSGSAVDAWVAEHGEHVRGKSVRVEDIRVEDRARRTYDRIDSLAASIETVGLLHPLIVTADLRLIAGGRRLEAARSLGWERIPVTIAENLTDAAELLQAEQDENSEREPLKPSEAADLAAKIEAVLKPLAAERQQGGAKLAQGQQPKTREVAAKSTGYGHETIRKVRLVQEVIESETTPEPVRQIARDALADIDATGKVDAGHKAVRTALSAAEAVAEFPDLAYYADKGDHVTAARLGNALRAYGEPELSMRLNALRATIAADQRRDDTPSVDGPDYLALADRIFVAFNNALQVANACGGGDTIREALAIANPLAVELWRSQFKDIQTIGAELFKATRPQLRSVK